MRGRVLVSAKIGGRGGSRRDGKGEGRGRGGVLPKRHSED